MASTATSLTPILRWVPLSSISSLIPTNVMNSVTGLGNSFNNFVNNTIPPLPQVPQYFFTVPFPNNQTVLYRLRILGSTTPANVASTLDIIDEFIFPLTPSNISRQVVNLTNYYDVKGDPNDSQSFGVKRIIDLYGLTPPIISISGTTGFQFHSLDNFQWSGKASFARLIQVIQHYAALVAAASNSLQQLATFPHMEFTDGYTGETYDVVPISQQAFTQDLSRPIYQVYNLQFLATASVASVPIGLAQQDAFVQAFIRTKALLTAGLLSWWNSILGSLPIGSIV